MNEKPFRITLKAARVNAGLTQVEAAEALGISAATYQYWEKDPSQIRAKYQNLIEDAFGLAVENIIFLESD